MNSTELKDLFRRDVIDLEVPPLWSDEEVFTYMNDAYVMFVRLTGGVADFTSAVTELDVVEGEPLATLHPSILRVMSAKRRSDDREIEILNSTDIGRMTTSDYGQLKPLLMSTQRGPVTKLVIGMQRGVGRWIFVPDANDTVDLLVYRLPLERITGEGQEFVDVEEIHHFHLLKWMKSLAYRKQDAETFDRARAAENEALFLAYCQQVKAEWERYKHKNRVVAYGGI